MPPGAIFEALRKRYNIIPLADYLRARIPEREIERRKTDLERLYGIKIEAFAFPNGDCSEHDIVMTRNAGYRCALTMDTGINDIDADLFRLRRIPVPDDASVSELLVKASGFWRRLKWARGLLKQFLPGAASREATAYDTATPKPQATIGA